MKHTSTGPTFVAEFVDGETTRMTCHCTPQRLDPAQGLRMSIAAYETRVRVRRRKMSQSASDPIAVPEILSARFEDADGKVLAEYTAEHLNLNTAIKAGVDQLNANGRRPRKRRKANAESALEGL
jgi:hypothetical protein